MNKSTEGELPNILIIDDDSTVVMALHKVLCHIGRIRFASDAAQAFLLIEETKPELILLDVELPDMNGLNVCNKLKENPETCDIPVLFITSRVEIGFEEKVFDAGASDYIVKPLKPRVVAARVQTHLAYHRAMLQLDELAHTDSLSSLANRRTFDEQLELEFKRARRQQEPLTIMMIDIDEFKKFNDYYGHISGDKCIRSIGLTLSTVAKRPTDLAARYGGEEFSLILPDTDDHGAIMVFTELMKKIEVLEINHAPDATHRFITVSAGYTTMWPEQCDFNRITAIDLVQTADEALYISKDNGRNQATFKHLPILYSNASGQQPG
ncbi:diguanylate cyclase [Vibrio mangrovi]|uniref:diguanylate cyclase n=1 Tax=Vibrio mangrovi TaxID=474394 RepID=A0A1Y6IZ30_9VIBR|nr:diguanylate cyclase [Vibrio mangrovi]MDW6005281.1 diguanylate cyclase [Vibrio mangrovi]SMS02907.1 Phytochrome-like protein cph2 [Vibrio mangrovi]